MNSSEVAALSVQNLSVPFGTAAGLRDVSFNVAPGERVVVLGPSGVGKTSMLRAIAGLTPVTKGSVHIDGRDVTQLEPERRGAVYMHQTPLLFPHLTVYENVAFPLRVRGIEAAELHARVTEALSQVQLETLAKRAPHTLSGGQKHRTALARAVVARPAVLLLDEPFASLDPALRDEVREEMLALQAEYRLSLVLITHDVDEAGLMADRIGVLGSGRLVQIGSPAELFEHPAGIEVAHAMGRRAMLRGMLSASGHLHCELGTIPLSQVPTIPPSQSLPNDRNANLNAGNSSESNRTTDGVNAKPVVALFLPGALEIVSERPGQPVFAVRRVVYKGDGQTAQLRVGAALLDIPIPAGTLAEPVKAGSRVSVRAVAAHIRIFRD